jgi:hypothetical protein
LPPPAAELLLLLLLPPLSSPPPHAAAPTARTATRPTATIHRGAALLINFALLLIAGRGGRDTDRGTRPRTLSQKII